jgi:hypothetical protein
MHRRGALSMQKIFETNLDKFLASYEETSREQQSKIIENKELME